MLLDNETSFRLAVCRLRRIDSKEERRLLRSIRRNRRTAIAEIAYSYNSGAPVSVSQYTVPRTLLRMGLCSLSTFLC